MWWEGQDLLELSAVLIRIWPDESRFTSFPTQSFTWNVFKSNAYRSQEEMYLSEVTWMGIVSKWRTSTPWNGSSWYSAPVSVHHLERGGLCVLDLYIFKSQRLRDISCVLNVGSKGGKVTVFWPTSGLLAMCGPRTARWLTQSYTTPLSFHSVSLCVLYVEV